MNKTRVSLNLQDRKDIEKDIMQATLVESG